MNIDRKWVGKNQKKILNALTCKPMTRLEIIETTGVKNANVVNALYAMEYKGLIIRDGKKYSIKELVALIIISFQSIIEVTSIHNFIL